MGKKHLILCLDESTLRALREFLTLNNMQISSFLKMLIFDEIQQKENEKDLK